LKNLQATLGADLMQGTAVVPPTQTIDAGQRLRIGGRVLDLLYFGDTHSPGAIAVLDRTSGVLFAGGIASIDRIPEVRDANIEQWIAALGQLQTYGATLVVPAPGRGGAPLRSPSIRKLGAVRHGA
jgi:glyoxylase-like metal-dependent hydrolase (beta-lactamase superfamily II)